MKKQSILLGALTLGAFAMGTTPAFAIIKTTNAKSIEATCGKKKAGEKTDKEATCGDKKTDAKMKEGKCGEGKCGDKKMKSKMKEGKCGEGKCGDKKMKKETTKAIKETK